MGGGWWKDMQPSISIAILIAPLLVTILMPSAFLKYLLAMAIAFGLVVAAYDFASVRSGYINLGQTFVIGVAGYGAALMSYSLTTSIAASLLLGTLGGALLGILAARIRGPYYAIATMVLPLLLIVLARSAYPVFRGDDGIPVWTLQQQVNIEIAVAVLITVAALMVYLSKTRYGLIIKSMSYDEMLTTSSGINTTAIKLSAYSISGLATGVASFYLVSLGGLMSTALVEPIPWLVYMLLASGIKPGEVIWSFNIGLLLYIVDILLRASFPNMRLFIISIMLIATYIIVSRRYAIRR